MSESLRSPQDREPDQLSDAELLAAHHAGDVHAFAVLFRRYRRLLKATAMEILRDSDDADDAVQEAMLRAVRYLHTLREPGTFPFWLKTLTARAAINQFSKGHLADRRSTPTSPEVFAQESQAQVHDPYAASDLRLALLYALAQLNPEIAGTWISVTVLDEPPREVAAKFGVPLGTVKSRTARAGRQIAEIVRDTLWGPDEPPQAQPPHAQP